MKRMYGLDWPDNVQTPFIDLTLAKKWMLAPFKYGNLLDPGEHMLRAIHALFTPEQWTISPWTEEHAHAWANEDFSVWLGAASCSKSNDAGGLAVLDWITDPTETYIALASTSVPMLKLRSFESVLRYFRILKAHPAFLIPGKEATSQTAIVNVQDDELDATDKASIRGVALADGDEAKAVARLAGSHLPFVTMILDEGSALPPAASAARFNARAGTRRFRFLSLANPISRNDEATKFCVPIDGWASVDENTGRWRSRFGLVLHRNGFNSPAIAHPERYPYLINQAQIDAMLAEEDGNRDALMIWRMVRGFPPPDTLTAAVLSPLALESGKAFQDVRWLDEARTRVGGLDPAFTSGGDKCILQLADVGLSTDRIRTIAFLPPIHVPISPESPRPAEFQISDYVRAKAVEYGFSLSNLAVDESGTQSVGTIIAEESGQKPMLVNFANRATPLPLDPVTRKPPKPRYRNTVTELWYRVAHLVQAGRVRQFPRAAADQFCSRRYVRNITPLALEPKKEYAVRNQGRSPDEGDALALCVRAAERLLSEVPRPLPSFRELLGGSSTPVASYAEPDMATYERYI